MPFAENLIAFTLAAVSYTHLMTQALDKDDYKEQLATEQARLSGLMRDKRMRKHALLAVFEGNDAAGKGGAIRRVTGALDPRQYRIVPVAAPTEEELSLIHISLPPT